MKLESVQVLDAHCSLQQHLFTPLLLKLVSQQEKWGEISEERIPKHHLTPLRSPYAYGPRNTSASCWGAFAKNHYYMETEVWACLICECSPGQLPHFWGGKSITTMTLFMPVGPRTGPVCSANWITPPTAILSVRVWFNLRSNAIVVMLNSAFYLFYLTVSTVFSLCFIIHSKTVSTNLSF